MKKERTLSEKEVQRKLAFDEKAEKLVLEGYTRENCVIGVVQANILAIVVTLPFVCAMAYICYMVWSSRNLEFTRISPVLFFVLMIAMFVIHELIHGITWGIFAKNHWKDIEFGIIWEMITPYCACRGELKKVQYIIGSLMPTIILGFGLGAVSIITGNLLLFILAEIMIIGGGGDFIIAGKMLMFRIKNKECIYFDHPTECGFVAFYK